MSWMKMKAVSVFGAALLCFGFAGSSFAQTTTYSYDAFGRLSSVTTSGGATTSYTYDVTDNRSQVARTSGAQVVGAMKPGKGRRWIQFALGRKSATVTAKSTPSSHIVLASVGSGAGR